jgi:hypothetical protein
MAMTVPKLGKREKRKHAETNGSETSCASPGSSTVSGHESTLCIPNVPFGYSSDIRGNQYLLYYHDILSLSFLFFMSNL